MWSIQEEKLVVNVFNMGGDVHSECGYESQVAHALHVEVGCCNWGHMSQSFEWMCEGLGLIKEDIRS